MTTRDTSSFRAPAQFSLDRNYRYTLWRAWDMFNPSFLQVIGLNPSTATETVDDPTIRRCIGFARAWGYGGLCMTNLFAERSTDPRRLVLFQAPIGPDNDTWLLTIAAEASLILAAWGGGWSRHLGRANEVAALMQTHGYPLHCLGYTADHAPRHPLYVPKTAMPLLYVPKGCTP